MPHVNPPADVVQHNKQEFAADLVIHATAMLNCAARLRGEHPSFPMNAEFQALDIMRNSMDARIVKYRAVLGHVE